MTTTKDPMSLPEQIRERFAGAASGQVLTPRDFLDLGSRAAVDQALTRLRRDGHLRRVGRGLYALPREHPLFGELSVTSDAVADALAGRDALRLQPAGGYATNQLGLTEQAQSTMARQFFWNRLASKTTAEARPVSEVYSRSLRLFRRRVGNPG